MHYLTRRDNTVGVPTDTLAHICYFLFLSFILFFPYFYWESLGHLFVCDLISYGLILLSLRYCVLLDLARGSVFLSGYIAGPLLFSSLLFSSLLFSSLLFSSLPFPSLPPYNICNLLPRTIHRVFLLVHHTACFIHISTAHHSKSSLNVTIHVRSYKSHRRPKQHKT